MSEGPVNQESVSEEPVSEESAGRGPFADVLREYPGEERKRRRREFKTALEDREAEKAAKRAARYKRRARRAPFIRAGVALVGLLPPSLAAWFGDVVGTLLHVCGKAARHRALFQLRLAFPDTDPKRLDAIARSSLRLLGRGFLSLPALRRKGKEWIGRRSEVVDEHLVGEALEGGKGAIVVTLHFGPMVSGGVWLARDWNGVAVGRDARTLDALQVVIDLRAELGLPTIERGNPREILRALRDNRPVAILADHDVAGINGVFVPFFGHLAHTAVGPAALSLRTGAPILVAVNDWVGLSRYRVRLLALLRPREDLPRDEAIHELTYRFTKISEAEIRAKPDHWMWLHKRWETRPERRPELPIWRPADGPDSTVGA